VTASNSKCNVVSVVISLLSRFFELPFSVQIESRMRVKFSDLNIGTDIYVAENSLRNSFLLCEDVSRLRLRLFRNRNLKVAPQTVGYVT